MIKKTLFYFLFLSFFTNSIYAAQTISPLGWAIIKKDVFKAKGLIENSSDLRAYENEDSIRKIVTPNVKTTYVDGMETQVYPFVILAAANGQEEIIKALHVKDKKSIYLKDKDGNDALMWATRQGHLSSVKLLLSYGLDPLYETDHFRDTAYELALNKRKYKILSVFIDKLVDEKRTSVLSYTIWRLARTESLILKQLLENGVKDTYKGVAPRTSLMKMAEVGNIKGFELLVKYGSDPYESNQGSVRNNYDPLTSAVKSSRSKMIKYLLKNFDYDLNKTFKGDNYLHLAYNRYNRLNKEVFLWLLNLSKLDINSKTRGGSTLLSKAVANADIEYLKFFIGLHVNKETIKDALKTAKWYEKSYKKQYEKVQNDYNLKNYENVKEILTILKKEDS